MKNFRKTKIIGTIGPASDNEETLRELMKAGLNCARINFSHGGYEENEQKINLIKRLREELGLPIALQRHDHPFCCSLHASHSFRNIYGSSL